MSTKTPTTPNGETKRKAEAWNWVVKIGAALVPVALAGGLALYAQAAPIIHDWPEIREFIGQGPRWTQADQARHEREIREWVDTTFSERLRELKGDMAVIKAQNSTLLEGQASNAVEIRGLRRDVDRLSGDK